MRRKLYVTILAGGMGKRMNSSLPKVLHLVKGESMIVRILKQVIQLEPDNIIIVVGQHQQMIQNEISQHIPKSYPITYARQETPLGTGDAVRATLPLLDNHETVTNIILNGDVPLLRFETIQKIYHAYLSKKSRFQITAIHLKNPTGNGRIIIDANHSFQEIVEEKDCNQDQKFLTLVNCGIYICDSDILLKYIPQIQCHNAQKEYYITDLVKIYKEDTNQMIDLFVLDSGKEIEIYNVNTETQLNFIQQN